MARNGKQRPSRPRIEMRQGWHRSGPGRARPLAHDPSPEQAAAIAAAIEQFLRDTAPAPASGPRMSPWLRAGLFAGTGRDPSGPSPWGDQEAWGR